jgi:hypothetical protein
LKNAEGEGQGENKMSKLSTAVALSAFIALSHLGNTPLENIHFNHKDIVKRVKAEKIVRPGRNRPAKGYDPISKTWKEKNNEKH